MKTPMPILDAIFNAGERLIPGESHDRGEVVRHKSSYMFFYDIIEKDILNNNMLLSHGLKILDIGSGTGHGTLMLSKLPGVNIVGLEPGLDAVEYARNNYAAKNIEYINEDLDSFIKSGLCFDYVVSRHALEHIMDGLNLALAIPCQRRLIVNVPFNEDNKNPFHLVHWIDEKSFANYNNKQFFYESMDGVTSLVRSADNPPNSIVCVASVDGLEMVSEIVKFPFPAWKPEFLQELGLSVIADNYKLREAEIIAREEQVFVREEKIFTSEEQISLREKQILQREEILLARESEIAKREDQVRTQQMRYDRLLLVRLVRKIKRSCI